MPNPIKPLNTLMTNTHVQITMDGWPATVFGLGICGTVITAILAFGQRKKGGEGNE